MSSNPAMPLGAAALDKGLSLFLRVARDQGDTPLAAIARELSVPLSSARRLLAAFERQGLIVRVGHGRYAAGATLAQLGRSTEPRATVVRAVRPLMRELAQRHGATAHLGILEGDMVTYLAKEQAGRIPIFTRETNQLEAYGSGLGKVLLAYLDDHARETYLEADEFVALTKQTLVRPADLRAELARVRERGYAIDDREVADDVYCIAVPILGAADQAIGALSVSGKPELLRSYPLGAVLEDLRTSAAKIAVAAAHDETMLAA